MIFKVEIACLSNPGKVRRKNEDNFFFDGEYMPENNDGSGRTLRKIMPSNESAVFAVFDGMGGENYGEKAAYAVAQEAEKAADMLRTGREDMAEFCLRLNTAVVEKAREMRTRHMGSTVVAMKISAGHAVIGNVGDSPAFLLRNSMMKQISEDHVEKTFIPGNKLNRKPSLSQYLGVDPEEFIIEPFISQWDLRAGDRFLLCSDGITDMLNSEEIKALLLEEGKVEDVVQGLVNAALDKGGRDNITAILCVVS